MLRCVSIRHGAQDIIDIELQVILLSIGAKEWGLAPRPWTTAPSLVDGGKRPGER